MPETFSLGTLLTGYTGRMLASWDELYRIVDYVTGETHMTHQLGRACGDIAPWLLRQHPWLAEEHLVLPGDLDGEDAVWAWLETQKARHGDSFEVEPMPEGMYVARNPMLELRQMMGPDKPVVAVVVAQT
jgi:hypothetical protein